MFGRKSTPDAASKRAADRAKARDDAKKAPRPQVNMFGLPDGNGFDDVEEDDSHLEAELFALIGGGGGGGGGGRNARRPAPQKPQMPMAPVEVPDFGDSEGEVDEDDLDDPDLEAELSALTESRAPPPPAYVATDPIVPLPVFPVAATGMSSKGLVETLSERLEMYEKALENSDKSSAKGRRLVRAIKTLKDLIKKAKTGAVIDEADIPPVISTKPQASEGGTDEGAPPLPRAAPSVPEVTDTLQPPSEAEIPTLPDIPTFEPLPDKPPAGPDSHSVADSSVVVPPEVAERIKEYKKYAVALKRSGDVPNSLRYLKLAKTLESAASSGSAIDLSSFPSLGEETPGPAKTEESSQGAATAAEPVPVPENANMPEEEPKKVSDKPMLECLEERLEKYKSEVQKASEADNSSKARRMGRIVKQYEDAIKLYKRGKPVPYEELPTPPGFDELPVPGAAKPPSAESAGAGPGASPANPDPSPAPTSAPAAPAPSAAGPAVPPKRMSGGPTPAEAVSPPTGSGKKPATLQQKQLSLLLKRQQQFKTAAINAKKRGDVEQAREYLRTCKGIDKLIQANQCGLPVDMNTVPAEPEAVESLEADNFEVVSAEDCIEPSSTNFEAYSKLEEDLKKQMKMCMQTRDHYKAMGDIASANRFEKLAIESKQDLDVLRLAGKQGGALPKFHYVQKVFTITECNTDLTEDEIEISVLQGINFKVANPTTVDTFVKVELAYPSAEELQTNKTGLVKDTNNPVYNATFKMAISRSARNFQRFVHRHGVKLEVWSKGGFLRSNTLIGTATAKLVGLESKCTIHDGFEILDGRKPVGKLEVKIRLRDPVLAKQITQRNERWLSLSRA